MNFFFFHFLPQTLALQSQFLRVHNAISIRASPLPPRLSFQGKELKSAISNAGKFSLSFFASHCCKRYCSLCNVIAISSLSTTKLLQPLLMMMMIFIILGNEKLEVNWIKTHIQLISSPFYASHKIVYFNRCLTA